MKGSILGLNTIVITDSSETSFHFAILGSITQAGPCKLAFELAIEYELVADTLSVSSLDAIINFPQRLTVAWSAKPLGQMTH